MTFKAFQIALVTDETGATAVEYGLIAALIAITALGALIGLADTNTGIWGSIETQSVDAMTN